MEEILVVAIAAGGQHGGLGAELTAVGKHNPLHGTVFHNDVRHFRIEHQADLASLHALHQQGLDQGHDGLAAALHTIFTRHVERIVRRGHLGLTVAEIGAQGVQPVNRRSGVLGMLAG